MKTTTKTDIIKTAKRIECKDCRRGINMCEQRPCWGTVKDFKKIIKAGYAKKLMIDYYNNDKINNGEDIYFLSGASSGNECSKADWNPKGTCIFLENNKCIIHNIKPTSGAVSCCKIDYNLKLTHACLMTWTTTEGKKLIEDWKKMVDYIEKDNDEGFNFHEAVMLAFGL